MTHSELRGGQSLIILELHDNNLSNKFNHQNIAVYKALISHFYSVSERDIQKETHKSLHKLTWKNLSFLQGNLIPTSEITEREKGYSSFFPYQPPNSQAKAHRSPLVLVFGILGNIASFLCLLRSTSKYIWFCWIHTYIYKVSLLYLEDKELMLEWVLAGRFSIEYIRKKRRKGSFHLGHM